MAVAQRSSPCWSASVTNRDGARARVYERYPGSHLQVSLWVSGDGLRRVSLRHKDRERGKSEARILLAERPNPFSEAEIVTLGSVLAAYRKYLTHHHDGTPKASSYLRDCAMREGFWLSWFGPAFPAARIRPNRVHEYVRARRAGKISGREVRTESIRADLIFLKGALQWSTTYEAGDEPLLEKNPLDGFKIPKEKNPRRPMLDEDDIAALSAVARMIHEFMPLLLLLVITTGRRVSSVLGLRWTDIDLTKRSITWRAELDKKRRGWLVPIPSRALKPLQAWRRKQVAIGDALLFPSRRKPSQPVSRHTAAAWLKRAFRRANVPKPDGSLWHCFRRSWGTARKHLPLPDVLGAGGWNSAEAYIRCYASATMEGMRTVVDLPIGGAKLRRRVRSSRPRLQIA